MAAHCIARVSQCCSAASTHFASTVPCAPITCTQIFWLNHGKPIKQDPGKLLGWVGRGVRLFAENSGMLSYIYRRSFALRALNDAQVGPGGAAPSCWLPWRAQGGGWQWGRQGVQAASACKRSYAVAHASDTPVVPALVPLPPHPPSR